MKTRQTQQPVPRLAAACASLALVALAPWTAARAQQCLGTNETQGQVTLRGLTHVDKSGQGAGGLEFYHPAGVTGVTVEYAGANTGRLPEVADQAHANRAATARFEQDGIVAQVLVFTATDKKHMCPAVNLDDETKLHHAQANKSSVSSAGSKKDTVHLYLVGAAPTRPLIGIVRMAQTTGAAKIVLKISRTLLDQANGKADPQLTAAYNISAEWWGLTEVSATPNNARSHWTGSDKGHTALLMVKPRTGEQARLLASAPKTSWHGGGVLNDEVGASKTFRDTLVGRHTKILRPQDRLSTTLEGESEYRIEKTQYDAALAALRELARTPNLGFTVTEMTGGKTQDTYYDFDDGTLFKRKVLLRRRYVAANDKGKDLFLFAIKARSLSKEGLMVRLSSQLNMSERKVGNQLQELTTLLLEDGWNPFAQIAKDGIGRDTNMGELKKKVLKKVLIIHSTRQKFAITNIKDKPGQSIDVTLDGAYGVRDGKKTSTV